MVLKKNKFYSLIAATLCSVMTLSPGISAIAADMPTGGSVQNGNVEIAYINPDHVVLNQNTKNSIIHFYVRVIKLFVTQILQKKLYKIIIILVIIN